MSHLVELKQLLEEDNTLKEIATKLNEQLTRLKVEEMALTSWIKMRDDLSVKRPMGDSVSPSKPQPHQSTSHDVQGEVMEFEPDHDHLQHLDLTVGQQEFSTENEESENEEDCLTGDLENLTTFLINQSHAKS